MVRSALLSPKVRRDARPAMADILREVRDKQEELEWALREIQRIRDELAADAAAPDAHLHEAGPKE